MIGPFFRFEPTFELWKRFKRVRRSAYNYKHYKNLRLNALTFLFVYWQTGFFPSSLLLSGLESVISTHMKTYYWFLRTRLVPHLRIASVVTLMSAAAAMAFVAVKPSVPLVVTNSNSNRQAIAKFSEDREELFRNKRALPGPERDGGPLLAAEIEYANRAYPAKDIPFSAILNATTAWANLTATGARRGPNAQTPGWTLVGP